MKRPRLRSGDHFAREEILLISVIAFLFVTFIVLVVLLIGSERNRSTLVAEYEADRAASALLEAYREEIFGADANRPSQNGISADNLPNDVKGFGVYAPTGEALRVIGSAPPSIAQLVPRIEPRLFRFDQRDGTVELYRLLGAMPGAGPGRQMRPRGPDEQGPPTQRGRMFGMMGQGGQPPAGFGFPNRQRVPAYVYIRLSTRSFFADRNLLTLALFLVPIVLGIAMVGVWFLYLRNRRYRAKIESQEHLVHLGEIARTLSHEIKNPLSAIRLQTGIMKRVLAEESPHELTVIEEETSRLTELVERIGEFLRDPIGTREQIDLVSFLTDLVSRFDWVIEGLDLPGEKVLIEFDRNRLRTVVENLLKNASESGGERTPFSIAVRATKQRVELRITDRGSGIPDAIREKIFDPFYTTKVQGSGIGLAISKRFVEALGGTLQLQNAKTGGTEAVVTLKRLTSADTGGDDA